MTRLPWQHMRSRTKSSGEKTSLGHAQDWFSRSTAEPSRQAFTDLVKVHNRGKSDESSTGKSRSRPRTNTSTSTGSQGRHSRLGLSDEETWSRSSSRPTSRDATPLPERSEGSNKVPRSKSGLLQRTSSVLSLSSTTSTSTMGLTSPPRSSRPSSAASRSDDLRSRISPPFDFQHITHTEDSQFPGLGRIDESSLADQFVAVTADQPVNTSLRGIPATDIQSSMIALQDQHVPSDNVKSTVDTQPSKLPQSPPRPVPPPKDESLLSPNGPVVHSSRASPALGEHAFESAGMMWLAAQNEQNKDELDPRSSVNMANLELKPLPDLPIVHAITTEDNIAREMITSPLPSPPSSAPPATETLAAQYFDPQRELPFINLRSQNLYPSTKSSMPNLLAPNHTLAVPRTLARHHSDMALSQQARDISATTSTRTSMSFAAVDIMNWEDAVDEAWDDVDDDVNAAENIGGSHPSNLDNESATSTPLMMTMPFSGPAKSPNRMVSTHSLEVHQLESVKEDETIVDISGLGISSCPASGTVLSMPSVPRLARSSSINFSKRRSSSGSHTNGMLTRSSSQESMVMSFGSSIAGTQRSSNSSVSGVDVISTYNNRTGELIERTQDECADKYVGTARPESGCLPPDILEQISQFGVTYSVDQVPRSEQSPAMPWLSQRERNEAATTIVVPQRRSSIIAPTSSAGFGKRANNWANRPRQSAQKYSLFPSTQPTSVYTSVTATS